MSKYVFALIMGAAVQALAAASSAEAGCIAGCDIPAGLAPLITPSGSQTVVGPGAAGDIVAEPGSGEYLITTTEYYNYLPGGPGIGLAWTAEYLDGIAPANYVPAGAYDPTSAIANAWKTVSDVLPFAPLSPTGRPDPLWPTPPSPPDGVGSKSPEDVAFYNNASNFFSALSDSWDPNACGEVKIACEPIGPLAGLIGFLFAEAAMDPADPNYTLVAVPTKAGLIAPSSPDFSAEQAAAWTDLVTSLNEIYGLPNVIMDSFNRGQGAIIAGDPVWEAVQFYAMVEYTHLAEMDINRIEGDASVLGLNLSASGPAPVPEPGTFIILGSTLFCLGVVHSIFRRKAM